MPSSARTILLVLVAVALGFTLGTMFGKSRPELPSGATPPADARAADSDALRTTNHAERESSPTDATLVREPTERPASAPALPDEIGILVYGSARSSDGEPIESCRLSFRPSDVGQPVRAATVDGTGYAVTGLTPGVWRVHGKPDKFETLDVTIEVGEQRTQRFDLTFERTYLIGVKIQTPDGRLVHEAAMANGLRPHLDLLAVATTTPIPSHELPMTQTSGHTRFGVGNWKPLHGVTAPRDADSSLSGTIELNTAPPVYIHAVYRHVILASELVEPGVESVTLTVPLEAMLGATSTIRGRVIDGTTGQPIPTAHVAITDSQSGGGGRAVDEDGRVVLEHQPIGVLELDASAPGFGPLYRRLRVSPGALDLGDILLYPQADLRVVVRDADGKPAATYVYWECLDGRAFPQELRANVAAPTDAAGVATLPVGSRGRYWIQAVNRTHSATAFVDIERNADEPVNLVLAQTRPVVFGPSGDANTVHHCLTIFDDARRPVWSRYVSGHSTPARLPPGRYTWELHDGLELLNSGSVDVRANGANPSEIALR